MILGPTLGCRLATCSNKWARFQLLEAAGWQPTAIKGLC